jgi:hypothetical protein
LVRIWFWLIALACSDRSILLGKLRFWSSVLGADLGFRLTPGLPPSEEGAREPPLVETQSLTKISIAVILMRTASEHFRGRVMGVRMLVIYGLPLGLLAAGSLIDEIGFAATGTLYAAAGLALMLAIVLHWRGDLWHLHAPANAK